MISLALSLFASVAYAAAWFEGPENMKAPSSWLSGLKKQRSQALAGVNYKGGVFDNPAMQWTQTSYIQPQMVRY